MGSSGGGGVSTGNGPSPAGGGGNGIRGGGDGANDELFCLRWNDYQDSITDSLTDFRSDRDFLDVSIWCGEDDKLIQAHRVVLSACSSFFKAILKKTKGQTNPTLVLWDVSQEELEAVLAFMYHGEVKVQQEQLNSFLNVAERLKVRGLCQLNNDSGGGSGGGGGDRGGGGGGGSSSNKSRPSTNRRPRSRSPTMMNNRNSPKRICKSPNNMMDDRGPEPDVEIKEERDGGRSHHDEDLSQEGSDGAMNEHDGSYHDYGYHGQMNDQAWGSPGGGSRGHRLSSSDSFGNNPRRPRSVYTTQQLTQLEAYFRFNEYIDGDRKKQLSLITQIPEHQIKVWFQNRRQKKKRELDEAGVVVGGGSGEMSSAPGTPGSMGGGSSGAMDNKPYPLD